MPSLAANGTALSGQPYGAVSVLGSDGNTYTFAGTETTLERFSSGSWSDVSLGGGYSTATDGRWEFTQYGDRIIATNYADDIQTFTLGVSSNFADLDASAPKAKTLAVVNNFVVAGNTFDTTDGAVFNRVRWSGLDQPTSWTVSAETLSDFQDIEGDYGAVQRIVGGQNSGVVIMERAIWVMQFVGAPLAFSFTLAEEGRGTKAPGSVVTNGSLTYYLGEDGFYAFDGNVSRPIGHDRVDQTFLSTLDNGYLDRIRAEVYPEKKTIVWSFPSTDTSDGAPDTLYMYNWADDRWTSAKIDHQLMFRALTTGYTLEEVGAEYPILEDVPFSLDSTAWQGGRGKLGFFTTDNRMAYLDGSGLTATFEVQEAQLNPQGRSLIDAVVPFTDASTVQVRIGMREKRFDAVSYTAAATPNSFTGEVNFSITTRYARAEMVMTGDWEQAIGLQYRSQAAGEV